MAEKTETVGPRTFIRLISQRWRLFLLSGSLFSIGVLLWSHWLPLAYMGTTIFERRTDPVADQTSLRGSESFDTYKLTLEHELGGLSAATQAVEQIGLTRNLPRDDNGQLTLEGLKERQHIVKKTIDAIKVNWQVRSTAVDLVSVSFIHSDPMLAERMPNLLVQNYINLAYEQAASNLAASRDFFAEQVDTCNTRLSEIIKQRITFEAEHIGVFLESTSVLQERIMKVAADIDAVNFTVTMAEQELRNLENLKSELDVDNGEPSQIIKGPNPELVALKEELQTVKDYLNELLVVRSMKETHPDVQTIRRKIEQLEERVSATDPEAVLQTVHGATNLIELEMGLLAARSRVEASQKELERLQNLQQSYNDLLIDFPEVRHDYLEILKKGKDKEDELKRWDEGLAKTHMALAAEAAKRRTHLNAVQAASTQFLPSSPSLIRILGFALLGGLAFGSALVFLAYRLDQSVMSVEAAKGFGIPVYGFVDVIVTSRQLILRQIRRWILTPVVTLILLAVLGVGVFSITLRLHHPTRYQQWQAAPVEYLLEQIKQIPRIGQ